MYFFNEIHVGGLTIFLRYVSKLCDLFSVSKFRYISTQCLSLRVMSNLGSTSFNKIIQLLLPHVV